jgi:hypothetical protein
MIYKTKGLYGISLPGFGQGIMALPELTARPTAKSPPPPLIE